MSRFFVSNAAFTNEDEELAHFDIMRGRLDALANIHQHLGDALEALRVAHASIGVEVQMLGDYISALSPQPPRMRARRPAVTPGPSGVKAFVTKFRLFGNATRR